MKTILYATDYSENSAAALQFSYALSKVLHTELVALHIFELPLTLASTVSYTYSRKEVLAFSDHRKKLMAFCTEHLKNEPQPLNITWKVDEGKPASDIIIKNAKELKADYIVVGAKGGNRVREMLLGSSTTALIQEASCPVLIVPENTNLRDIKKMVYATDFEGVDIFTIENLVQLAEPFEAVVHLIHVAVKKSETIENQMEWFKEMLQHKVRYEYLKFEVRYGDDIFGSLQNYINEIEPDLIAMLERGNHGLIKNLGHYDLVKRMKNEGHIPLLSYHKKNVGVI